MAVKEAKMEQIAQQVGQEFGFKQVSAHYEPFRDFKVRWHKTSEWIAFSVSDYMQALTQKAIEDVLTQIFRKMRGDESMYSKNAIKQLTSDKFCEANRYTYIGRHSTPLTGGEDVKRLQDLIDECREEMGMENDVIACIAHDPDVERVGLKGSNLMRVITFSPLFCERSEPLQKALVQCALTFVSLSFDMDPIERAAAVKLATDRYITGPEIIAEYEATGWEKMV